MTTLRKHRPIGPTAILLPGFLLLLSLLFATRLQAAAPTITSLSPTTGAVGASVTIAGTNFGSAQGSSTVKFNGTTATATSWGAASIVATVPTGATTGNVVITVSGTASNGKSFTVVGAPSITSLSITAGAVGAAVTVTGTNFGTSQGTGTVKFNGTTATVTSWSATSIAVTVPTGATTGNVVVFASGVNSNGVSFTVVGAPSITSLSITTGAVGAAVTITGTNFGTSQGTGTVKFNGTTATVTSWSATSIAVTVPTGATTGNVVVFASGVNSNGVSFTVEPPPSISGISPTSGAVGSMATITGLNFGASEGTSTVTFSGTAATPTSWTNTSITVVVPSAASGSVVVTVSGQTSDGVNFTVGPLISGISPASSGVGTSVAIYGMNFGATQGTSTVIFNGTSATPTSWTNATIVTLVPPGATSGNVVVSVAGQTSNAFAFAIPGVMSGATIYYLDSIWSGDSGAAWLLDPAGPQGTLQNQYSFPNLSGQPLGEYFTTDFRTTPGVPNVTGTITAGSLIYFNLWMATNTTQAQMYARAKLYLNSTSGSLVCVGTSTYPINTSGNPNNPQNILFNCQVPSDVSIGPGDRFYLWTGVNYTQLGSGSSYGPTIWFGVEHGSYVYVPEIAGPPGILSLSPTSGGVGSSVTITGADFAANQGTSLVTFNGAASTPASWSDTSIVVPVPSGATTGPVVVTVQAAASNGMNFTVIPTPSITGLSPGQGAVGASVTISGTSFGDTQGSSTVTFNGTPATITSWTATSIVTSVPAGAATGNVLVSVSGLLSNGILFTVAPAISTLSQASAVPGTLITITGANFGASQGTSGVTFNGVNAIASSWGVTSIIVTVPMTATSGNVVVSVSGLSSNGIGFTVIPPVAPNIISLSPNFGPGGVTVTITGVSFGGTQGLSTVTFDGLLATTTSWSDGSISSTVPAAATTGPVLVTVGGVSSNSVTFTVSAADLQIASPSDGTVVNPGQSVPVSVTSPDNNSFTQVAIIGEDPVGFSTVAEGVPAQFTMSIPDDIACRMYLLTAAGTTAAGQGTESQSIRIDVERPDLPTSLSAQIPALIFESQGEETSLQISGTFSDGSILDVTQSSNLAYISSNPSIATVDANGLVTAVGIGNTWIAAKYSEGGQFVQMFVPVTVLPPLLSASPSSLSFGSQTIMTSSASQQVVLTNSTSDSITVLSVSGGGDFSETDNCASSLPLPPGGTCTVAITFTPSVVGPESGGVTITNNIQSVATTIPMAGIGAAAP